MIIEIEVDGAKKRVTVDDSFRDLTPEQQQQDVDHIAQTLSKPKEETKKLPVEEGLNEAFYPYAGAVAGAGWEGAKKVGRGISNVVQPFVNPGAAETARLEAQKNAVETWARTQNRVPGMVNEKPGLYFGQPEYSLESAKAKQEMAKMMADPEYHAKVLAEQKPGVAAYQKRVSPTIAQKATNMALKSPLGAILGGAAGYGLGTTGADAINRWNRGDKLGSMLSGIETAAGAAASCAISRFVPKRASTANSEIIFLECILLKCLISTITLFKLLQNKLHNIF
jgi:hypothetical protein